MPKTDPELSLKQHFYLQVLQLKEERKKQAATNARTIFNSLVNKMAGEVAKGKIEMQVESMSTDEAAEFKDIASKWGIGFDNSVIHFNKLNASPVSLFSSFSRRAEHYIAGSYEHEFFTLYPFVLDYEEKDWLDLLQPQLPRVWSMDSCNLLFDLVHAYVNEKFTLKSLLVTAKELHLFNQSTMPVSMSYPLVNLKLDIVGLCELDLDFLREERHKYEEFISFMLAKWTE